MGRGAAVSGTSCSVYSSHFSFVQILSSVVGYRDRCYAHHRLWYLSRSTYEHGCSCVSQTPERRSGQVFSTLCLCFPPFCSPLRAAAWPLVSRCNYNFPFPPQGWLLSSLLLKEPLQAFSEMQKEGSCPSLALRRRKGSPPSLSNSLNVECQSTSSANPEAPGLCGSLPLDMVLGWQEKLWVHSEVVQAVTPQTHSPHSLLSGLLEANGTRQCYLPPWCLCAPSRSPPPAMPRRKGASSQKAQGACPRPGQQGPPISSERETFCFPQLTLISSTRAFWKTHCFSQMVWFISEHFYISTWDYYPFLLWLFLNFFPSQWTNGWRNEFLVIWAFGHPHCHVWS